MGYVEQSEDNPNLIRELDKLREERDKLRAALNEAEKALEHINNEFADFKVHKALTKIAAIKKG